jgi:hypothetical protein
MAPKVCESDDATSPDSVVSLPKKEINSFAIAAIVYLSQVKVQ